MKDLFLLNLRISGIKNIEKPIEIPFYKRTIKDDFNPEKYRIKGIYGENGSGKTAIITAVKILTSILLNRSFLSDSVNQRTMLENINKKTRKGFIEVTFFADLDNIPFIYQYKVDFEIKNDERVYLTSETLKRKNGRYSQNDYQTVFDVSNGELLHFGSGDLYHFSKERTQNLLEQRSFATFTLDIESSGYNHASLPWMHLYSLMIFAANIFVGLDTEDDHHSEIYRRLLKEKESLSLQEANPTVFSWTSSGKWDYGNEFIIPRTLVSVFKNTTDKLFTFIRIFKTELKGIELETKEYGDDLYLCRRIMIYDGYELDAEFESRGIRKLINLFEALDAACKGTIVFIDELDSNINDVYLGKLLEYFTYYGKGQLCFTAHNLSPMSVLRESKCAITFISSVNTVHTWTSNGNLNPENAYRMGFIEDSPFNVFPTDFLGVLGGSDE